MDTACGFAAHSLMPAGARVLTVELKINLLAPAIGTLRVVGQVTRSGRTLSVCTGDAYLEDGRPARRDVAHDDDPRVGLTSAGCRRREVDRGEGVAGP